MRFAPTDEQRAMREAVRELLSDRDCPVVARSWSDGKPDPGREIWQQLAEMGVAGVAVPESLGGQGFGPVEVALCLREIGYHGLPGPWVESIAAVPRLLLHTDRGAQLLRAVVSGKSMATATFPEHVRHALDADQADVILRCDAQNVLVLENPQLGRVDSIDPARRLFTVDAAPSTALLEGERAQRAVSEAADYGILGCAAQLLGLGARMLDLAKQHAVQRHQFGRPIGEFQAVKHHLANALLKLEFARPLLYGAGLSLAEGSPQAGRDVSAAKLAAGEAAYAVARTALQVHGAIGYTAEHELHLWLAKTKALRSTWGTPAWHRQRVARSLSEGDLTPVGGRVSVSS